MHFVDPGTGPGRYHEIGVRSCTKAGNAKRREWEKQVWMVLEGRSKPLGHQGSRRRK